VRWERGLPLTNIEDRRGDNPEIAPSPKDSLLRNLPASKHEWELYQELMRHREARRKGKPLPPDYNLPISIEAHRNHRQVKKAFDAVFSISPELERQKIIHRRLGPKNPEQQTESAGPGPETERARQHSLWMSALREMKARDGIK
jgi:hypothetical protein